MRAPTLRLGIVASFAFTIGACGGGGGGGGGGGSGTGGTGGSTTATTNSSTTSTTTDPHVEAAFNLINQSRAQFGAPPLTLDPNLNACGLVHAQDVASCSGDNINDFTNCAHNDFKAGQTCGASAENQGVASGVSSSNEDAAFASINQAMMAEGPPPAGQDNHFLNITNPSETAVGIGLFIDSNGNLWISEEFR